VTPPAGRRVLRQLVHHHLVLARNPHRFRVPSLVLGPAQNPVQSHLKNHPLHQVTDLLLCQALSRALNPVRNRPKNLVLNQALNLHHSPVESPAQILVLNHLRSHPLNQVTHLLLCQALHRVRNRPKRLVPSQVLSLPQHLAMNQA
jgi:hypothetical protein